MLLQAEKVRFSYDQGGKAVLQDAGLNLPEGNILGLVGPNGSGKSTFLRILAGIIKPQQGRVLFSGKNMRDMDRRTLSQKVAFLPQSVQPLFPMTVEEMVALGRFPHQKAMGFSNEEDRAVVQECMEWTEVTPLASRPLSTLSGGEHQRVLVASVLAQQPRALLLDEPTSALDLHHQVEVCMLLEELAKKGIGIIMVTHDLNLAARFCNSLVLLNEGRVAVEGTPEKVLQSELLHEIYRARMAVGKNPATGLPMITVLEIHGEEKR